MVDLVPGRDSGAKTAVALVIILAVGTLIGAIMLPVGLDAIVDDNSVAFTDVSEGDENEVISGSLNVTLDNVNDTASPSDISVTMTDVDSGNTLSLTNVSTSQNGTLEGETLTVQLDNVDSATQADFTVLHPVDYAWSSGAQSLWDILDVIMVLAVFLLFIGVALKAADRV